MICAIYKSKKKAGMYLYIAKRDEFSAIPETLRNNFGTPIFVMLFNLKGDKSLINADNLEVLEKIQQQGFYLQMPKQEENLLELHKKSTALH
ncbi:YcgL domain-containing protein [Avibacterium sp. 21-599]|uniref:YcgL domain-containing protein n=1 Tax=Avibacterium sp. 21-599 TaxID=2911528 RepID=UPI002245739A|nr:YcgL domain-containing protein [Avibacterium sp. 21-599]MCW9718272.1 YcgL domain-containing protein [Avibacterium sp. 21-599]